MTGPFESAVALVRLIKARELSCLEALETYLQRVDNRNRVVNAVVTLDADRAREKARHIDSELVRGSADLDLPLLGVPMTVKDVFETEGLRTTAGARELSRHIPDRDAEAVRRLRTAGVVVFGKTNVPRFAGDIQTYNDLFGVTSNPWDRTRTAGGSSGGSAAAVATGMSLLELGSDIGGSVRNPAHFCGITAHKPSFGLIPLRGHIPGPPTTVAESDLAVAGLMGRSAQDVELLLRALSGPDARLGRIWNLSFPDADEPSDGYRVGVWVEDDDQFCDPVIVNEVVSAAERLEKAGARCDFARPTFDLSTVNELYERLYAGVACSALSPLEFQALRASTANLSGGPVSEKDRYEEVLSGTKWSWNIANEYRYRYALQWETFMERFDVVLCPVMPTVAFPHDHREDVFKRTLWVGGEEKSYWRAAYHWTGFASAMGLPSTLVPVAVLDGLPCGIQVVGRFGDDLRTIRFARLIADTLNLALDVELDRRVGATPV